MLSRAATDESRARRKIALRLTLAALLVSFAGLIAVTVQFVAQAEAMVEAQGRQIELALQLRRLQAVLLAVVDAETGQRGYLLTGNERYLAPYKRALARLPEQLAALDIPADSAPVLAERARIARQTIAAKLAELADTVRLQASGHHDLAMARVLSDEGQVDMERLRDQVDAVIEIVRADREQRVHDITSGIARVQDLLVAAVSSLFVFTVLALAQVMVTLGARTRFEQALAESVRQHRAMIEEQSELVSLARADGALVYVNPAYARHFGREPAQMVGMNQFDLVDPAEREAMRDELGAVLDTGRERAGERLMATGDGEPHWVAWTHKRQRQGDEMLLYSVGRDITDRRRAERALRASQAFLHRTGRLAGIGGWEVDLKTGETLWSEEVRRILEAPPDYTPNLEAALATYPPEARAAMERAHADCIAHGLPWDLELPRVTANGRRIWVRSVGSLELEGGQPRRMVGAMQDVTERKLLEQRLGERERALRDLTQIVEHAPDFIVQTDRAGRIQYMNPALRAALGIGATIPLSDRTFTEFNSARANEQLLHRIVPAIEADGAWLGESTLRLADGRNVPVSLMAIAHRDAEGRVERYSAVMRDIQGEVAARDELQRQTATLASVTEAIPAMVCVVGADGVLRFANSAFERWSGQPRAAILGRPASDLLDAAEAEARRPWTARVLAGEMVNFETPSPGWRGARHLHVSYIPLWREGTIDGYVAIAHDITRHREEAERLLELSERDALTGLLNRTGFEAWLSRATDAGHADAIALLYVDLDHFKPVNDTFGHAAGDEVLRGFAHRLRELVRPNDAIARIGGDEFAIALSGVRDRARADTIAEAIVAAANLPFQVGALDVTIGASVGVAVQLEPGADWKRLVEHADAMLYKAKEQGRGTFA
jgi:diguanylate cyclase (GGDEF)-like protein/PAS domain S-box-containing protein